jgi:hypothetical protein
MSQTTALIVTPFNIRERRNLMTALSRVRQDSKKPSKSIEIVLASRDQLGTFA